VNVYEVVVDGQRPPLVAMSGVWPAWTCLVSNYQRAESVVTVLSVVLMWLVLLLCCAGLGSVRRTQRQRATPDPPPVPLWGPVQLTRACGSRLGALTWSQPGAPHRRLEVAGQHPGLALAP